MVRFTETGRYDPITAFRFLIQMGGETLGTFTECSGMKMETEGIEYREGGESAMVREVPGLTKSGPITLKHGLSQDTSFERWYMQIYSVVGVTDILPDPLYLRDLTLQVQDRGGSILKSYIILRAWPKMWTPGNFNSTANEIATEELTLANQGFLPTQGGGFAFSTPSVL